jgi:hypothetical protein
MDNFEYIKNFILFLLIVKSREILVFDRQQRAITHRYTLVKVAQVFNGEIITL